MSAETLVRLERLRLFRARPARDLSISTTLAGFERDLKRQERATGGAADAWLRLAPPQLVDQTRVVSLNRGTLLVEVENSAVAYEIDMALRAGLEARLRAALRTGSLRVRTRLSPARPA